MIISEHGDKIREWVSNELGIDKIGGDQFTAMAIMADGTLVGGAVFHDYRKHMIEISLATIDKKWCTKRHIRALLSYPFKQLSVKRLNVTCAKKNKKLRSLVERLGFKQEGCARYAYDGKQDAIIYGMLSNECKWI